MYHFSERWLLTTVGSRTFITTSTQPIIYFALCNAFLVQGKANEANISFAWLNKRNIKCDKTNKKILLFFTVVLCKSRKMLFNFQKKKNKDKIYPQNLWCFFQFLFVHMYFVCFHHCKHKYRVHLQLTTVVLHNSDYKMGTLTHKGVIRIR